ncbi:hypothetical protein ACFYWO_13850 [Streptomyces sp. NPDC002932]
MDLVGYDWTWNIIAVVLPAVGALLVRAARRLRAAGRRWWDRVPASTRLR